jgi:hypothetical protein
VTNSTFLPGYDGPIPIDAARVTDIRNSLDDGWSRVYFSNDENYAVVRGDVDSVASVIKAANKVLGLA